MKLKDLTATQFLKGKEGHKLVKDLLRGADKQKKLKSKLHGKKA